jgi:hypothetical protein
MFHMKRQIRKHINGTIKLSVSHNQIAKKMIAGNLVESVKKVLSSLTFSARKN